MYAERYRPQFHFSAREGWLNDPNGCEYYDGEYHLFFQHNPSGLEWGNMSWGHAVSPDLVHWRQLPHALLPYGNGEVYSGSAVWDEENRSGLGEGGKGPLVALFTHARMPFGQALAFSQDRGRTWRLYRNGEDVVPNQGLDDAERDPKVFWHAGSGRWIMVLWIQLGRVRFLTSEDLRQWTPASDFFGEGFWECPDLFELPVDGNEQNTRWVLHDAALTYWIGSFDGTRFEAEAGPLPGERGANFYAAQTWNGTAPRVVHIAWMRWGQYPGMPFNQQMSFPCELALRTTPAGIRLCRAPVAEIEGLYLDGLELADTRLNAGQSLRLGPQGDLLDVDVEVEMSPGARFRIGRYGQGGACAESVVTCTDSEVVCLGKRTPLASVDGVVRLRLLVDRTSIELFGNGGEVSLSSCFLPVQDETGLVVGAEGAAVRIRSLEIHRLASAWTLEARAEAGAASEA